MTPQSIDETSSGLRISTSRWKRILGAGWVGQQSFVAIEDVLEWTGLQADDVLLDVGCGDGALLRALVRARGCSGVGFDPVVVPCEPGEGVSLVSDGLETALGAAWLEHVDASVLISCDVIQYVEDAGQLLGRYLQGIRPSRCFVTFWHADNDAVRRDWGFAGPIEMSVVRGIADSFSLSVFEHPRFGERLDRQLASLREHEAELRRLWGDGAFQERLDIEARATEAAGRGAIRQMVIAGVVD